MFCSLVNTRVNVAAATTLAAALASALLMSCGGGGNDAGETPGRSRSATATALAIVVGGSGTPGASPASSPPLSTMPRQPGDGTATPAFGAVDPGNVPPSATPLPPSGLTLVLVTSGPAAIGSTVTAQVRVTGSSAQTIAAFNFDLVYDEAQVRLEVPEPNRALLDGTGRDFNCSLPPPSADVEPAPAVGRARLVCFSFGGEEPPGARPPATLATIRLRPLVPGEIQLQWERVALFAWDGSNLGAVEYQPAIVTAR